MRLLDGPRGGTFWACPDEDCRITFSMDGTMSGHPAHVAKASSRRGRVFSQREDTLAKLKAHLGYDDQQIEDFVNEVGLAEAKKLLE